ncbi:hypothetical protein ACS15_1985 [Ralstonia insidiosa]|uniref:Uncharacterized protein n=1 Tax=Ralstonia insidiosa TaxID=190721 RepID=A0AAC9BKZ1_9RALS|nr:hypothetical protein ACS15_1985 [Ralstonia insidiosa]
MAAGNLEIVGKCGAVDDGLNGSWHDGKPAERWSDGALVVRHRCCNAINIARPANVQRPAPSDQRSI